MIRCSLIASILFLTFNVWGQNKTACFEIKYLDFFGLDGFDTLKFPADQLDQLLLSDFTSTKASGERRTNFLIPPIVMQLRPYHPNCSTTADTSTFRKLTQLYFKIRQLDLTVINDQPISDQLNYIRDDFYTQVQNDSLLPFMSYTLDDGPFFGQLLKPVPDYKKGRAYQVSFGTLYLTKKAGKVLLTAVNKQGKHLWTRVMTGNSNRLLTDIQLSRENIRTTSLGYTIRMIADGEGLTLYLKSNGDFLYYFHSW